MQDIFRPRDHGETDQPPLDYPDPTPSIVRSDTLNQELIYAPASPEPAPPQESTTDDPQKTPTKGTNRASSFAHRLRPSLHIRKRSKNSQISDFPDHADDGSLSPPATSESRPRSLSGRLKRFSLTSRSRTTSASSINVPDDLPEIPVIDETTNGGTDHDAEWERRAALLAQHQRNRTPSAQSGVTLHSSRPSSPDTHQQHAPPTKSSISTEEVDAQIQTAIALHESGELERSTAIFRTLADPEGTNNAFSQLLYGLALRHGWGCALDPSLALQYHSLAASNSAAISLPSTTSSSSTSLATPLNPTDAKAERSTRAAARGELVLAIYELGNAFRHGLGCTPDPIAARRYYETAAELGDVDAMIEAAWCCEHGYGGGKDKWRAARLLRMAEGRGARLVGASWVSVCLRGRVDREL
jgi:hypothetical protein